MTDNSSSGDLETEVTYFATKSTWRSFDDHKETVRFVIPEISRTYPVPIEDNNEETAWSVNNGTKRVSTQITFPFSFSGYNLKARKALQF